MISHQDKRDKIIGELLNIIEGASHSDAKNKIEDVYDYETTGLLSQCYHLLGQDKKASNFLEKSKESIMDESNHISDPEQ